MLRFLLIFSLFISKICYSQFADAGAVVVIAKNEKDPNKRIQAIYDHIAGVAESDPLRSLRECQELLIYSQQNDDRISEGLALCIMGYLYRGLGNTVKSLDYNLQSIDIAHETGNDKLLAVAEDMTATNYKDLGEYSKALQLEFHAAAICEKMDFPALLQSIYQNISEIYIKTNKPDSALTFAQKDYELSIRKNYYHFFSYTLTNLGDIHNKLGKPALALTYYDMAIDEGFRTGSPKMQNWAYTAKANFFLAAGKKDSTTYYSRKAITSVENTPFKNYSITPAKMLLDIYENTNSDSAVKYSRIHRAISDSVYSTRIIQQTGLLSFEAEVRKQELAAEKLKTEQERRLNLQYILLAISIITFMVLFLLLSRSIITNAKVIRFLGILALLILFEFLNLLLHPFLEKITHHSPVIMLLALVAIASLLIPIHHRLEKWAIQKLVDKNKETRLAAAKRTIEKLEPIAMKEKES